MLGATANPFVPRPLPFNSGFDPTSHGVMSTDQSALGPQSTTSENPSGLENAALYQALTTESEAHMATKIELQRAKLEIARLASHNQSLQNTVKMLGGIIKHNTEKPSVSPGITQAGKCDVQEPVVPPFVPIERPMENIQGSILHDALAKQRAKYETEGYPSMQNDPDEPPSDDEQPSAAGLTTQHAAPLSEFLVDLGAFATSHAANDTNSAPLSEAILRQFSDPINATSDSSATLDQTTGPSSTLIGFTPEQLLRDQQSFQKKPDQTAKKLSNCTISSEQAKPVLSLPASILLKYGSRPKHLAPYGSLDKAPSGPVSLSKNDNSRTTEGHRTAKAKTSVGAAVLSKTGEILNIESQKDDVSLTIPINWMVNAHSPVFSNEDEKFNALGHPSIHEQQASAFYDHPVRYLPEFSDKNLYRTAIVDFIPLGASYKDVLEEIRGGALESIAIFGPVGKATDFLTARIVFHHEQPARDLYLRHLKKGTTICGQKVRVWLVLQPTYPKNRQLAEDVFEKGYTRLLLIGNATPYALSTLHVKLASQISYGNVIEIAQTDDGIPIVEFTSVVEAMRGWRTLIHDQDFRGAVFDFEEDYCGNPYRHD